MSMQLADLQNTLHILSSGASQNKKNEALHYLEQFQRSKEAWNTCHEALSNVEGASNLELHIFAAQTIRNKVTYDLSQLERNLVQFKDSLLRLLTMHTQKLVITQLNVALARLAIQFLEWRSPIAEIINVLNPYPGLLLSFFQILPEETFDIGSIPLTEDEYNSRVHELVDTIAEDILKFLISCTEILKDSRAQSTNFAMDITLESVLRCFTSWSFEFSIDQLFQVQPLISLVFESLNHTGANADSSVFEAAVDCLCGILKESRDTTNEQLIMTLFEQLIGLQRNILPNIQTLSKLQVEEGIDPEILEGMTRLFVEAIEAWVIFIAKSPEFFQPLISMLLMLTCKNPDLDVVSYSFPCWFSLKQNFVLPRYQNAKAVYTPTFIELINGIIEHLQYPPDHFDSKEGEDKFKEFRYHMGDVLKDCTAVVGTNNALEQPLIKIKQALSSLTIAGTNSINWQNLEAPLFSLRTMAQEISLSENKLLPEIFQILCNLPEHPKLRYASTLVLGRYTEWTAKHPETLEMQLQYIFKGFQQVDSNNVTDEMKDIITASSHALMYFCSDCSSLLSSYIDQLTEFYFVIQDVLSKDIESQFELCQGLSAVINNQPIESISETFGKLVDDNLAKLGQLVTEWKINSSNSNLSKLIADKIDLFYAFFEELKPKYEYPQQGVEPLLPQIEKIWNAIRVLLVNESGFKDIIIVERSTKFLRRLFERFHVFCEPILGSVAEFLVQGYATTGYGSFLWCSGSIIVIFGDDDSFPIPIALRESVWQFALSQCKTFIVNFSKMNKIQLNNYYEIIMDFFAMVSDLVMFFPKEFILSTELLGSVIDVAIESINKLENYDAYVYILRCLDDTVSWGFKTPPISTLSIEYVPDEWRSQIINEVVIKRGSRINYVIFLGLLTTFESNSHSDAIGCIVKLLRLATEANNNNALICSEWLTEVFSKLNETTHKEKEILNKAVVDGLTQRNYRKIREGIRNFVQWYLRKNVTRRVE
ncbi:hypothetical protein KAFR_0C05260 [Kazachstania africana CBS 2517]|uniref:Importin N-terminal domain-containing protein n=1 Tax=Kazachstania africana (strain ATCC 22294 / BCRC 22015 / CBS 2517 / CECT 1963 / NBRC 1671 / NRRL Y-8276) TaxID=1071382 RepID=H2AT17_KAZAF|nr:hypothetical protein KAFR_0C05260 [Kazachstania africana CBS 2517]CCF57517.1 hypothetical protein KAFR_0C05260 [Kazachstania africana CBS 2517]